MSERLLGDLAVFARECVASTDLDPAYPVLRELQAGLDREAALWSTICYVATYKLASAVQVLAVHREPEPWQERFLRLPTGVERRALRGGHPMRRHLDDVLARIFGAGSIEAWLTSRFSGDPRRDWNAVRATFTEAWGNGRWASYKLAEVLMTVNGWPIEATDMGNDGSTGPRKGLAMLYGPVAGDSRAAIAELDRQGEDLQGRLADSGVPLGIEQVETALCDFHNLAHGSYYVGHDVDLMLGDLHRPEVPPWVRDRLYEARSVATPDAYRGEVHGWLGMDRDRRRVYRDTGVILTRP